MTRHPQHDPVVWICADNLYPTLERVRTAGGVVLDRPQLDGGGRWLAEIADPAGNRVGIVTQVRAPAPQPLIAVRDVEASSRWYQRLLGLESGHGGPHYERLLADGVLVLQLHRSASPQLNVLVALGKEGSVWSRACGWVASRSPEVRLRAARLTEGFSCQVLTTGADRVQS
jgi:hypothetical protein